MGAVLVVLGAICALYGLSVFVLSSATGTWFFLVWFVLAAALAFAGWAVHVGLWKGLPVLARRLIALLACALLACLVVTQALVVSCFDDRGEPDLDYIVVLGAQVREDGPSPVLRYRLDAAYDYLVANPGTMCIVSGGKGPGEPCCEADGMAEYLIERGIPESRIIRERQATNTVGNIRLSLGLLDAENDRVGIVTNNFHVFRGVTLARANGMRHACGIAAYSTPFYLPHNMLRETLGIAKDLLMGNLTP